MFLLIDWGNTRLKYLIVETLDHNRVNHSNAIACESIDCLIDKLIEQRFLAVLISSVRSGEQNQALKKQLLQFSNKIFFAQTSHKACGVCCAYSNPNNLGVDRWLAIIAASRAENGETVATISIGTAITIDVIKNNQHLGGQIAPGKKLLEQSLKLTDRVKPESELSKDQASVILGGSTKDCVDAGVSSMIAGYLSMMTEKLGKEYQVKSWLIHGGGSKAVVNGLIQSDLNIKVCQNMVFAGLIMLYQEKIET